MEYLMTLKRSLTAIENITLKNSLYCMILFMIEKKYTYTYIEAQKEKHYIQK